MSKIAKGASLLVIPILVLGLSACRDSNDTNYDSDYFTFTVAGGAGAGSSLSQGYNRTADFPSIDTGFLGDNTLEEARLCCVVVQTVDPGQDFSWLDRIEVEAEDQTGFDAGDDEVIAKLVGPFPPGVNRLTLDIEEFDITEYVDTIDEEIELKIEVYGIVPQDDVQIEGEIRVRFYLID